MQEKDDVKNEINFNENMVKITNFIVVDLEPVSLKICHKCQTEFNTENQLHHHIKQCDEKSEIKAYLIISEKTKLLLIISSVPQVCKSKFSLQKWHYTVLRALTVKIKKLFELCIDIRCSLKFIIKSFLAEQYPTAEVHNTKRKIQVHEIEIKIHSSSDYVIIDFYISGKIDNTFFRGKIT